MNTAEPIRLTTVVESEVLKHMIRYDLADVANAWIAEHPEIVKEDTVGICYVPTAWQISDSPIASKLEVFGTVLRFTLGAAGDIQHEPMGQTTIERVLPRVDPNTPIKH